MSDTGQLDRSQPLLRIAHWDTSYENNRSREIARLVYFLGQNDLADDSYVFLTDHSDGAAHLGGWTAILMLASRVPRPYRGYLRRNDGRAHDARSLALATRLPIELFEALLPRLLEIGLLEHGTDKKRKSKKLPSHIAAAKSHRGAGKSQAPDDLLDFNQSSSNRTEKNRTEPTVTERTGTEPRARESAALQHSPAPKPTSNPNSDDDENLPEQKLFLLFEQNHEVLTSDTLRRIREHLEVSQIDFDRYVTALAPKMQPNGHMVSATAIALDFAKRFGSKTNPARISKKQKSEKPRCPRCHTLDAGRGVILADDGVTLIPCPACATPEYALEFAAKEAERTATRAAKEGVA